MSEYLNNLRKRLEEENISNIDEIMSKYEDRYNFGLEAGLKEKEIEQMLGDIEDIVNKYKTETVDVEFVNSKDDDEDYKPILYVKVLRDDIVIKESKDDECHIYFEKTKSSYYSVTNSKSKGIIINYLKNMVLTLNKIHGKITIEIPLNKKFRTCEFNLGSADLKSINLDAKKISLIAGSGDIEFDNFVSKGDLSIHLVSGDIECKKLECEGELHITTVSGDIDIDEAKANLIKIDTVSGDVSINKAEGKVDSKSISGDIHVNGGDFSNLKKNIGRLFR